MVRLFYKQARFNYRVAPTKVPEKTPLAPVRTGSLPVDSLQLQKTEAPIDIQPTPSWIDKAKNWLVGWTPSGEKKNALRNTIEAARGKLSRAEYQEISDALESVPLKEQHRVLSLSIELARNRAWTPSDFVQIITEIKKMNPEQRKAVPIIAGVTSRREGSFSDMVALLHESNSQQRCSLIPTTYERFLEHLPKWLEDRRGSLQAVRQLFEVLHFAGSSDMGDPPEEIFNTVNAICNERGGDVSAILGVMRPIINFSEERKRAQRRREITPFLLTDIRELVHNREGNLYQFDRIWSRSQYRGNVTTDAEVQIARETRRAELNRLISACRGRPGSLSDIDTLNAIIQQLPLDRMDQILAETQMRIGPITDLITDLTPYILRIAPAVATRTVRGVNPLQVHLEAAIRMKPIFEFLNKRLDATPLLSTAESLQKIEAWINEADISHLSEYPERDRGRMRALLIHSKWAAALRATYANLGNNVNGELLLRTAATFCSKHPENVPLFIYQGLMDSIISYIDNPESLDNLSCANGIAERFILCFRNLASESTLIPDLASSIYNHPEYQDLISMGDAEETEEQKTQWLTRYRGVRNLETLRTTIQGELQKLQTKLQGEAPANTRDAFNTGAIGRMFLMFEDQRDTVEGSRLKRIFEAIQAHTAHSSGNGLK